MQASTWAKPHISYPLKWGVGRPRLGLALAEVRWLKKLGEAGGGGNLLPSTFLNCLRSF